MSDYLERMKILNAQRKGDENDSSALTDMDIIEIQSVLMDAGGAVLQAVRSGELAVMLAGVVALAYAVAEAMARHRTVMTESKEVTAGDYRLIDIMRRLSQKIADCSSGKAVDYATLYNYCRHVARDFLNADFDRALAAYRQWRSSMTPTNTSSSGWKDKLPDLADYLFE